MSNYDVINPALYGTIDDPDEVLALMEDNPYNSKLATWKVRCSKSFALKVANFDPRGLKYVAQFLKEDPDVIAAAMAKDPYDAVRALSY